VVPWTTKKEKTTQVFISKSAEEPPCLKHLGAFRTLTLCKRKVCHLRGNFTRPFREETAR